MKNLATVDFSPICPRNVDGGHVFEMKTDARFIMLIIHVCRFCGKLRPGQPEGGIPLVGCRWDAESEEFL